jgi:tetratricopeptide (TPR) repeat protein
MISRGIFLGLAATSLTALVCVSLGDTVPAEQEKLLRLRTLGKAFYENPTTQNQAVEQFKQALQLNPKSAQDHLNYALSLLRAGQVKEGIAALEEVQKADPTIPHTWFNLGIEYKKIGETDKAIAQLEQMVRLVPTEPISQYNLGVLYKANNRLADSVTKFELSARLDPNFAAPHFQLFNYYRQQGKADQAKEALARFQDLKRRHDESGTGNEDVEWSLYSEIYEVIDPKLAADPSPLAVYQFAASALPAKADPASASLQIIDLDGSGSQDLLVVSSAGIATYRKGLTPVPQPAFANLKGILAAVPGDYDNDGLVDLCVLTTAGPLLFHNTKTGFQKSNIALPAERYDAALWLDYDHDYDLDLVLLGVKSTLLRNQLPDGFQDHSSDIPFQPHKALSVISLRVIPDTKSHDLLISYADHTAVLYKDRLGGKFDVEQTTIPAGVTNLQAADLNNDSAPDVLWNGGIAWNRNGKLVPAPWPTRLSNTLADLENRGLLDVFSAGQVLRNESNGKFSVGKGAAGLNATAITAAAADFDADGKTDLALVLNNGAVQRCLNLTPVKSNFTRIKLNGVKNLKLAPNTEVEVKAGPFYQKVFYRGVPLTIGLRNNREIDTIRITWPNGLIQNETKPKPNVLLTYQEAQRLSGSCPLIWTWNGSEFEYITDVLGVAPLGASAGDGTYFPVDHDEYISIKGRQLQAKDNRLEVRITEELSEVSYLDQVQLIAVDHPAATTVYTNDKWKSPPFPDFRLFGVQKRIYPTRATEDGRIPVTDRLLKQDRRYPDAFARNLQNVAAPHSLELAFPANAGNLLVLHGWVDWADGSTFLAQAQATKTGLLPPQLQVKNAKGEWVTVLEDMGMPAGKPKTIAVDLTGKFLTANRDIRILTNLCVYWDEIFLSPDAAAPQTRLTPLNATTANLHFRGFAANQVDPQRKQPEQFFYPHPQPTSMWNPTPGLYTRYGEVNELLNQTDDKLAILGSGDEVTLLFDATALPPLPAGWSRDYLLKVDGWAKDRDANTAYSQTVEPLPFHGMSSYPYPSTESYPKSAEYEQYRKQYNTRPALRLIRALHETGTQSKQGY